MGKNFMARKDNIIRLAPELKIRLDKRREEIKNQTGMIPSYTELTREVEKRLELMDHALSSQTLGRVKRRRKWRMSYEFKF